MCNAATSYTVSPVFKKEPKTIVIWISCSSDLNISRFSFDITISLAI